MNSKKVRLPALGMLLVLLLTACNMPITPTPLPLPTQTPQPTLEANAPTGTGAACLVGAWQINDLNQYMQSALPQMIEGAQVEIQDVSGVLTYSFNADGTTLGLAQDFTIDAKVTTNGITLPGEIIVNGSTQGLYMVDESQTVLTLSSVTPGDMTVSVNVSGIPVVSNTPVNDLLMFGNGQSGSGSTNFDCNGNTLSIAVEVPEMGIQSLILNRVQP